MMHCTVTLYPTADNDAMLSNAKSLYGQRAVQDGANRISAHPTGYPRILQDIGYPRILQDIRASYRL